MIPAPCHQVTPIPGFIHFWLQIQPSLLTVYWERDWEEARDQGKDSPNFFLLLPHLSPVLLREGSAEAHMGPPPLPVSTHLLMPFLLHELPFLSLKTLFSPFTKMAPKPKKEASGPPKAEAKAKALKTQKVLLKGIHSHREKKFHTSPTFRQPKTLRL